MRGQLRAQAHRQAAIEAEPGIGVGLLAGAELALQIVELLAHVDQRLQRQLRAVPPMPLTLMTASHLHQQYRAFP